MNEQLHRAKLRAGIGLCTYEAIALAVDDPQLVPPITDILRQHRLLGAAAVGWVAVHLLSHR